MPSSATSATAFYAAQKQAAQAQQSNSQMFSNYQLQNLNKQKSMLVQKQAGNGSSLQGVSNGTTLQHILSSQAQQLSTMGTEPGLSSVNAEKGNKNSFYLKQ